MVYCPLGVSSILLKLVGFLWGLFVGNSNFYTLLLIGVSNFD